MHGVHVALSTEGSAKFNALRRNITNLYAWQKLFNSSIGGVCLPALQWKQAHGYHLPYFFNITEQGWRQWTQTLFFQKSIRLFVFDFGVSSFMCDMFPYRHHFVFYFFPFLLFSRTWIICFKHSLIEIFQFSYLVCLRYSLGWIFF